MATKEKRYKAGQCVMVEGKCYRVTKRKNIRAFDTCRCCYIANGEHYPCAKNFCIPREQQTETYKFCALKLPYGHFLKEIYPSHNGKVCDK